MIRIIKNVYEHADVLAMAVRLRRKRKCPEQVDNAFGEVVVSIVNLATTLHVKNPKYMHLSKFLFTAEVQSLMTLHALNVLDKPDTDTSDPKKLLNLVVKSVQRRLINYTRDEGKRLPIRIPREMDENNSRKCRNFYGAEIASIETSKKTCTNN